MPERNRRTAKDMSRKGMLRWVAGLVAGVVVILGPCSASADETTTYTYTGNAYDYFFAEFVGDPPPEPYDENNKVIARFTTNQPLAASYRGEVTPSSFAISDGIYTLTQDNALQSAFWVGIDSDGAISEWAIAAAALLLQSEMDHAVSIASEYKPAATTRDMSLDGVCGDTPDYEVIKMCIESSTPAPPGYSQTAHVIDNPGAWTVSVVPGPDPDNNPDGSDDSDTDTGGGGGIDCFIRSLDY